MAQNADDHEKEGLLIKEIIAEMESAHNRHHADELDLHFTANATWVNVLGSRLSGWNQINTAHRLAYEGPLRNSYARYEVLNISFVRSDVAIVHIGQHPTNHLGQDLEDAQKSIAIYVMAKDSNTWKVAAGQNTFIQ